MCECGCENKSFSTDREYSSTQMQSSSSRGKYRNKTKYRPQVLNNEINAKRRLTYDDEENQSRAADFQNCPAPQSNRNFDVLRQIRGLAIVRPQSEMTNSTLDYAGAVRRQNSNSHSRVSQKIRAALPPRGRTPCDPLYQSSVNFQNRRGHKTQ